MSEGYTTIPPEDQIKAKAFFDKGRALSQSGQYEYAIEMFISGLSIDPDSVDAHKDLRDTSMRRKASGGKGIGMLAAMKLKGGKDAKEAMLNCEKLLAFDPGDRSYMSCVFAQALKGGYYDTVLWIGRVLLQANKDSGKEDIKYYLQLKDGYRQIKRWKEAVEAMQYVIALKPNDMEMQREQRDLSAMQSMEEGKYDESFRSSVRDMSKQRELMDDDADIRVGDALTAQIGRAEAEWQAEPNEYGKMMRLVDLLAKSEDPERENRALELLESAHDKTKQYRFRKYAGEIKVAQLSRMERSLRQQLAKNPNDENLKKDYTDFVHEKLNQELAIYQEAVSEYPTDTSLRYNVAKRLYALKNFDEAIPALQEVRGDPKFRTEATMYLGIAFLEAGFSDESVDTFKDLIESYPIKGDDNAIQMYYWYGRALEGKNDIPTALKAYSQVAQWKFNFRDVQSRIKRLRGQGAGNAQ